MVPPMMVLVANGPPLGMALYRCYCRNVRDQITNRYDIIAPDLEAALREARSAAATASNSGKASFVFIRRRTLTTVQHDRSCFHRRGALK